jgi:hypothetical protein
VTGFDPTDPPSLRDPYPVFERMRARGPVHWSEELSGWLVLGWKEVQQVVSTPELYSANRIAPVFDRLPDPVRASAADVLRWLTEWMVFQDPPAHTRIRRHLFSVISPRSLGELRGPAQEITGKLLDGLPRDEPFEFYAEFGLKLPGFVVMDLLGVPRDRLDEVKSWSDEMMLFIGSSRGVADKYGRARLSTARLAVADSELGGKRIRAGSGSSHCSRRPTGTRRCSPTPPGWTWPGGRTNTWRSPPPRTSAWAPRWPGWRRGSQSASSSPATRTTASPSRSRTSPGPTRWSRAGRPGCRSGSAERWSTWTSSSRWRRWTTT